jgi:CheY-like chemotaxis protein
VDDKTKFRDQVKEWLGLLGIAELFDLREAGDMLSACRKILGESTGEAQTQATQEAWVPDIVLLDIRLPLAIRSTSLDDNLAQSFRRHHIALGKQFDRPTDDLYTGGFWVLSFVSAQLSGQRELPLITLCSQHEDDKGLNNEYVQPLVRGQVGFEVRRKDSSMAGQVGLKII